VENKVDLSLHDGHLELVIDDVPLLALTALLQYLYTDAVKCDKELLPDLLKCATRFALTHLEGQVQSELSPILAGTGCASVFKKDMSNLLHNQVAADVTFLVEGIEIKAHSIILQERADYFKAMFCGPSQLKEWFDRRVNLEDISIPIFKALLTYLYTWDCSQELDADTAQQLLEVSSRFMVDDLRRKCEVYLCNSITPENVLQLYVLADTFKSLFLKEDCLDYIMTNYSTLCAMKEWREFHPELKREVVNFIYPKAGNKTDRPGSGRKKKSRKRCVVQPCK